MEKNELRMYSPMSAFTFYLDDMTKLEVMRKLKAIGLDTAKGAISATIRVLMSMLAENRLGITDDELKEQVQKEYLFTTKKNKRSSL